MREIMGGNEFLRYRKQASEKRIAWDTWLGKNMGRISHNPLHEPNEAYTKLYGAWFEGYNLGERSLDEEN